MTVGNERRLRLLARAIPLALALILALGLGAYLVWRAQPPPELTEEIFTKDERGRDVVRPNLKRAEVVIPGRPHPYPFQPHSKAYVDAIGMRVSYRLTTSSRGWRNREVSPQPAAGITRVVTMGDSITFGHGVQDDEAYPLLLERKLASQGEYEVVNVSDLGTESSEALQDLTSRALPLHPAVVTVCVGVNDVVEHYIQRRIHGSWGHGSQERQVRDRLRPNLVAMASRAREAGVQLVLVVPPMNSFFALPEAEAACQTVRDVAQVERLPLLDLQAIFAQQERQDGLVLEIEPARQRLLRFRGGQPEELLAISVSQDRESYITPEVYPYLEQHGLHPRLTFDESHPTAEGHRLIAELLAEKILQLDGQAGAASP